MGNKSSTQNPPRSPRPSPGNGTRGGTGPVYTARGPWIRQLDALAAGQEGLGPVCLVENSQEQGLVVYSEALRVLSGVKQPVVVVAAIESDQQGVSVGPPPSQMWVYCLPHPHLPDHTLVLLNTEVHLDEGNLDSSRWLLVLTLLLCSSLIHTSLGDITQQDMEQLRWLSDLPKLITSRARPERGGLSDSHGFALFFPDFIWAVLDCAREPRDEEGQEIPEDEFLERALRLQPGSDAQAQRHNLPRECIRQFFPERRCFLFQRQPEEAPAGLQEQKFLRFLREEAQPKTLPGGLVVTGELLGKLAEIYVGQIRAGAVPCLERALRDVAPAANAAAVAASLRLYRERMECLELPLDTVTELLQLHGRCEREALELFMQRAFPDGICNGQAEFMRQVEALKDEFFSNNERLSRARCEEALQNLSRDMETRNRDRSHGLPGGHLRVLVEEYWKLPRKGLKAAAVLQEFLKSRSIPRAERSIRAWRDQCLKELEQRMRTEKEDEQRQRQQEQLRRRSEHQRQLKEKLEDLERRRFREHQLLMALKSKEEESLRRDGFQEQADRLFSEIVELSGEYRRRNGNREGGKGGNAAWNNRNAIWNNRNAGWNGGNAGWNGGDRGWNGTSNSDTSPWIAVLLAVLAVLAFILLRI